MPKIENIKKQTKNRFLNLYEFDARDRVGHKKSYYVASRAKETDELKAMTHNEIPDGVIIYALEKERKDRILLIRQYRYPLGEYVYEFPAGLVDEGENFREAAIREVKEETGLEFYPLHVPEEFERPFFTTVGMTDECCATVYGYVDGKISKEGLEDTEDIEVILADKEEVRRILKEERVAIMCAYMLMHFLADEEPFKFLTNA